MMRYYLGLVVICAAGIGMDVRPATALGESLRPPVRPGEAANLTRDETRLLAAAQINTRPQLRPASVSNASVPVAEALGFQRWVENFKSRALSEGVGAGTLEAAFQGVRYDPDVIKRDQNQSEFVKPIWDYLDSAASESRVRNGKSAMTEHEAVLHEIETRYGVEKEVVVAIWGLESAYGFHKGTNDVVRSLATLAYDGRRGKFYEAQLVAALRIVQNRDTNARNMTGSWAGAMGHTQFIPTSYLEYAVDFRGDGKRDIWSDDPTDALASTAAYLARFGWTKGQPWGVEVSLPDGFDYALADRKTKKTSAQWAHYGVTAVGGNAVPEFGKASILLPAGSSGAAFMIFDNFRVLERYNAADAYVIGVGHLSDRLGGGPAIQADWPRDDRTLTVEERKEMQRRLTAKGFSTRGVDGKIGPNTQNAVRSFQRSEGLIADGYPSLNLLERLR